MELVVFLSLTSFVSLVRLYRSIVIGDFHPVGRYNLCLYYGVAQVYGVWGLGNFFLEEPGVEVLGFLN